MRAVALDGKLYAVGGFDRGTRLDSVDYDPSTNTWEAVAAMSTKGSGMGAVALDGKLYAVGGYVGRTTPSDFVERWPIDQYVGGGGGDEHEEHGMGAVALDGKLYAVGGCDGSTSWFRRALTHRPIRGRRWRR